MDMMRRLLELTCWQHQKKESSRSKRTPGRIKWQRYRKSIEKGNDIEKTYDEIAGQIRKGEGGSSK
jgi:hypothetical protein